MKSTVLKSSRDILLAGQNVGGKALGLARLTDLGFKIPRFICLAAEWRDNFLIANGVSPGSDRKVILDTLRSGQWPEALKSQICSALTVTGLINKDLAVRSSAIGEDHRDHSFAGLFESQLYVSGMDAITSAIQAVWISAYSARVNTYLQLKKLSNIDCRMAIIIQDMIDPDVSGVAFSRSPLPGKTHDWLLIDAVLGVGEGLVNGDLEPDHFEVHRHDFTVVSKVSNKTSSYRRGIGGGTQKVEVPETKATAATLSHTQVQEIARASLAIEQSMGHPLDLEWCVANGTLLLLQARPIASLPSNSAFSTKIAGDERIIWDNANIVESFSGTVMPLTFSHATRSYKQVYIDFCRIMGVPEATIHANDSLFGNMLGLVRGRDYYNLLNWYKMLYLLPNAKSSSSFMETMMGVKESLGDQADKFFDSTGPGYKPSLKRKIFLIGTAIYRLATLQKSIEDFRQRVVKVCDAAMEADYSKMSLKDQLQAYQRAYNDLVLHWQAPILNDTRCMLSFGILKKTTETWLPNDKQIFNDLLGQEAELVSAAPARILMQLAQRIREGSLPGRDWLLQVRPEEAISKLRESYELRALCKEVDEYLREYGCRCADEAKLETEDLTYDASPIFVLLKTYLSAPLQTTETRRDDKTDRRREAELLIAAMSGMRRWIMRWLVKQCSAAIADRESLRLLRSRTYGVPRRIFRAMGQHLTKLNLISSPKDIFWLTVDELENLVHGKAVSLDLKGMIHLRSTEYVTYDQTPAPAERIVSRGLPGLTSIYSALHQQPQTQGVTDTNILVGTSCYPGRVEGKALVARTFTEAKVVNREILVAERTDPGWVTLYPVCSALVVERGSLLSHSAVVARELGLPTIIGVSGLTSSIRSGQHLIVDAGAGEVRIVPEAIEPTPSLS